MEEKTLPDRRPLTWADTRVAEWARALPPPYLEQGGYPYAKTYFVANAFVEVPFWQRFLVLFSGRLVVKQTLQCEHDVHNLRSSSHAYTIWWPLWLANLIIWFIDMRDRIIGK